MKSHFYDKDLADVYDAVGGIEAFRRISKRFHQKVEEDARLVRLFPKNMAALEERLALFLAERSGGDAFYTGARGKNGMICRHAHLAIGSEEASSWIAHMKASLEEEGVSEVVVGKLLTNLGQLAATLADPLIRFYPLPLATLREKLEEDPSFARRNDHGRSLIGAAAIAWDVPRLRLLLEFGADVETKDAVGHTPLYRVANGAGDEEKGRAALELLIANGANVNLAADVGCTTPLHMSARRGTVVIAETLLTAGAKIEARDSNGETPLRRAVNCGKLDVARLLLANGADPHSQDRHGRAVVEAVRDERMRDVLSGPVPKSPSPR